MHIMLVTTQLPWGPGEAFIIPEIEEMTRLGHIVTIFPLRPGASVELGPTAEALTASSVYLPLLGVETLVLAARAFITAPVRCLRTLARVMFYAGSIRKAIKNLVVYPKGLALSILVRCTAADHIHVHWASTPASIAYIASCITGIPFSITAHRWDIKEANMLAAKVRQSSFIRAISEQGRQEILASVGPSATSKCKVIHVGVVIDQHLRAQRDMSRPFTIACPANLIPVKGHAYLIDACGILHGRGVPIQCWMFGDGPLRLELQNQIDKAGLSGVITIKGRIAHKSLLELYRMAFIDTVVLPSIRTSNGDKEGIPVSLMEAMAVGIPVVSTDTGGIPELLGSGKGLMVPERDTEALAGAIECLYTDLELYSSLSESSVKTIRDYFSVEKSVHQLCALIEGCITP